ncbi:MAG: PilZ domain-containing protein [Mariprofundus sp.]|nr:PilZ domain-containing protein [Mariprofundus sp.]
MKLHHNQRQYSRSKVAIAATLTPEKGKAFAVEVVDLSMSGIFVHTDQTLAPNSQCQVSILLGHYQHELPILADAVVVRSIDDGIALCFKSVKLESFTSMQHVIVEHADDPKQAAVECSSHGGFIFTP